MNILVIDGQGGRLGRMIVAGIRDARLPCELLAIGTNSIATANMLKAGADAASPAMSSGTPKGDRVITVSFRQ